MNTDQSSQSISYFLMFLLVILLPGCGGGGGDGSFSFGNQEPSLLERCVEIDLSQSNPNIPACSLEELPFIGQLHSSPDADDIMARVLAEDSWMEERFRAVLERMTQPERDLFRAVRGIVIQDQINPSFYIELTAAIYLSPYHLWVTADELNSIARTTDPRAGNDDVFQFQEFFRYVNGSGDHAFFTVGDGEVPRTVDDSFYDTTVLLYHELAHANDFFPYSRVSGLEQNSDTPRDALGPVVNGRYSATLLSDSLSSGSLALQSTELDRLAETLYFGVSATSTHLGWSATDLGTEFEGDIASDLYAYSNQFEDFAMLFEEMAMQRFQQLNREVVFTDYSASFDSCSDLVIRWGQRSRIEVSDIQERALLAASSVSPDEESNFEDLVNSFDGETQITPGTDVCTHFFGAAARPSPFNSKAQNWRSTHLSVRDRIIGR